MDTALENGINFFDHADIYAGGEAEAAFGKILTPSLREQVVIQTKCAIRPGICYDFSREHILKSVDGSLKRLNTEYVIFCFFIVRTLPWSQKRWQRLSIR